jgi:hypothetical protein
VSSAVGEGVKVTPDPPPHKDRFPAKPLLVRKEGGALELTVYTMDAVAGVVRGEGETATDTIEGFVATYSVPADTMSTVGFVPEKTVVSSSSFST